MTVGALRRRGEWSAVAVAAAKVVIGLTMAVRVAVGDASMPYARYPVMIATVVAFAAAGTLLLAGARDDRRPFTLGVCMLLVASSFTDSLAPPTTTVGLVEGVARSVVALRVDAFWPGFLWAFVAVFPAPATSRRASRVIVGASNTALLLGAVLFAANLLAALATIAPPLHSLLPLLTPLGRRSRIYTATLFLAGLPALPVLALKVRGLAPGERQRLRLFVTGLVLGTSPTILWVATQSVFPALVRKFPLEVAGWVLYPTLLATPFVTAYAVLVRHALDVRIVIRRALQYAMARHTVMLVGTIPFLLLGALLYSARDRSMMGILQSADGAALLFLGVAAWTSLSWRRHVLGRVDRRFFREQYDAQHYLTQLVERCSRATDVRQLAHILQSEIERALHVQVVSMLALGSGGERFVAPDGGVRPLAHDDSLLAAFRPGMSQLDVDLDAPTAAIAELPSACREWLADADARLLVHLRNAGDETIGLLVLGEKRSELPYSSDDKKLLGAVAAAAALALQQISVPSFDTASSAEERPETLAAGCEGCGLVQPERDGLCERCGAAAHALGIPLVVTGKFRLLDRVGQGAMGVVYRALDLTLDRVVAIKTLPRLQPEQAARLRREARAIAAVSHPNLALIYGAESWHGVPLLVLEYLPGGTLGERLKHGPVPPRDVLAVGIALADAVAALHRVGILHRDIKPSNIGFGSLGTPKLLDFGVARVLGRVHRDEDSAIAGVFSASGELSLTATMDSQVVGTPLYLSPEAIRRAPPSPMVDVWALSVVLLESMLGHHPFRAQSLAATLTRIADGEALDLRLITASLSAPIREFFERALSRDSESRPQSAEALREALHLLAASP